MLLISDSEESNITLKNDSMGKEIHLPGVLQSISIGGDILWDTSEFTGSKNSKITKGYKEKTITINLLLLGEVSRTTLHILDKILDEIIGESTNTPYQALEDLERLFKETEESSKPSTEEAVSIMPSIYTIRNDHINKRGINEVCFVNLTSSEDNAKDYIKVTITFEEIFLPTYTTTNSPI